jgi:hypothetical protein
MRTRLAAALFLLWPLHGCAAIPIAVVLGPLLEAGGSVLVETGTEYTASGAALRTFSIPIELVHGAVVEALQRTDVTVRTDEWKKKGRTIMAETDRRTVRIRLVRLTRVLTSMELVVKRNFLASDKATASEVLAQTEQVLSERHLLTAHPDVAVVRP